MIDACTCDTDVALSCGACERLVCIHCFVERFGLCGACDDECGAILFEAEAEGP